MRLLFSFFLLSLFFVLLIDSICSDLVPLINLGDRSMYSSRQNIISKNYIVHFKNHKEIHRHANYSKFLFSKTYSHRA